MTGKLNIVNHKRLVENLCDELIKKVKNSYSGRNDVKLVKKAIEYSTNMHQNQYRKSGEPYITHPLSVAITIFDWTSDIQTTCAALLHDVVEDTEATIDVIKTMFGDQISYLVESVTKVSTFSSTNRSVEAYSKNNLSYILQVFMSMGKDVRVMFIKIADRLHNMLTIGSLKIEKQRKIAYETQEIYANIAGRLGMFSVKTQLLDLCFSVLNPSEYKKVENIIQERKSKFSDNLDNVINKIKFLLRENNIVAEIKSRVKGVYSAKEKIKLNESLPDLFGIRILTRNVLDCYLILGIIHINFYHGVGSFKDFISAPKDNLYQTLHTCILYKSNNIEIQVRTYDMEKTANFGLAAHWKYKESLSENQLLNEVNKLLGVKRDGQNIEYKISQIKSLSKQKSINVLDEQTNSWKQIFQNSTVLDFAYILDEERFPFLLRTTINGVRAPLFQNLNHGDVVKIEYSDTKLINRNWLFLCNDPKVRKTIEQSIDEIHSNIENSSDNFVNSLIKTCGPHINKKYINEFIDEHFNCQNIKEFIEILNLIKLRKKDLHDLFSTDSNVQKPIINYIQQRTYKWIFKKSFFKIVEGAHIDELEISPCCTKIPTVDVIGILKGSKLEVHKHDCKKAAKAKSTSKTFVLHWDLDKVKQTDRTFATHIKLYGVFNPSISNNVLNVIQRFKGNVSKYNLDKNKISKQYIIDCVVYLRNYSNLEKIINELYAKKLIDSWKLI